MTGVRPPPPSQLVVCVHMLAPVVGSNRYETPHAYDTYTPSSVTAGELWSPFATSAVQRTAPVPASTAYSVPPTPAPPT